MFQQAAIIKDQMNTIIQRLPVHITLSNIKVNLEDENYQMFVTYYIFLFYFNVSPYNNILKIFSLALI
jgi:hypothetical protein